MTTHTDGREELTPAPGEAGRARAAGRVWCVHVGVYVYVCMWSALFVWRVRVCACECACVVQGTAGAEVTAPLLTEADALPAQGGGSLLCVAPADRVGPTPMAEGDLLCSRPRT